MHLKGKELVRIFYKGTNGESNGLGEPIALGKWNAEAGTLEAQVLLSSYLSFREASNVSSRTQNPIEVVLIDVDATLGRQFDISEALAIGFWSLIPGQTDNGYFNEIVSDDEIERVNAAKLPV